MPTKGTTSERGYGPEHRRERRRWADRLRREGVLPCARCAEPIHHGVDKWHLGHTDDRTAYTGPEHEYCNTSDGGRRRHQATTYRRRIL